jgi:DNA-directed RNA polymerase specialized sigma subunit
MLALDETYKSLSDAVLIGKIIDGDQAAIAYLLIGRCGGRLKFLVNDRRYYEMGITLEDLVNEIFIIVKQDDFRTLKLFHGTETKKTCSIETYISVIANRFLSKKLKKFLQEKKYKSTQVTRCRLSVGNYDERQIGLDELTNVLSSNERKVIESYKLNGMSVMDVAGILETTETNIYTIYSRAINKLKKHFAERKVND